MRASDAMTKNRCTKKLMAGVLVFFGLVGIGLSECQAQMGYSGGFVPHYRHPTVIPGWSWEPRPAPADRSSPSYFPDHDSYYPSYSASTPSVSRFYYPGEETQRSAPPFGVSAAILPWNRAGFQEYDPYPQTPPETSFFAPTKYALAAMPLSVSPLAEESKRALLIVHLPEHAMLWIEGKWVPLQGQTSYFHSPVLAAGKKYAYAVRVAWLEQGHFVNQTQKIPIEARSIQALYLRRTKDLNRELGPD